MAAKPLKDFIVSRLKKSSLNSFFLRSLLDLPHMNKDTKSIAAAKSARFHQWMFERLLSIKLVIDYLVPKINVHIVA
jgi:hypothetical protein